MAHYKKFSATKRFWKDFEALTEHEKSAARALFEVFKKDPFAEGLGTHRIIRLSALRKETVWSVPILHDLRTLFVTRGDEVISIGIGSHAIYKG